MDNQFNSTDETEVIVHDGSICTQLQAELDAHDWLQASELKTSFDGSCDKNAIIPSYKVIYAPKPIGHPHGMTEAEVRLVQEAERHICNLGFKVFYAVLSDDSLSEAEFRTAVRAHLNRLAQIQRRAGIPPIYVSVFEGETNLHTNILFPLPVTDQKKATRGLSISKHFAADGICVKPYMGNWGFTRYTAKERTYADRFIPNFPLCKRRPGHHPLGKLGGERVRLSKHLESQLIANGRITPRKKTKARKI